MVRSLGSLFTGGFIQGKAAVRVVSFQVIQSAKGKKSSALWEVLLCPDTNCAVLECK